MKKRRKDSKNCFFDDLKAVSNIIKAQTSLSVLIATVLVIKTAETTLKPAPIVADKINLNKVVMFLVVTCTSLSKQKFIIMFWNKNVSI